MLYSTYLNGQIERAFVVRLKKAMILMKNAGLNSTARSNKFILIEAIKTASFLYDECPQANEVLSSNQKWFASTYTPKVKINDMI